MNRGDAFTLTAAAVAGLVIGGYYVVRQADAKPTEAASFVAETPLPPIRPTGLLYVTSTASGSDWKLDADSVRGPRAKRQGWVVIDHSKDKSFAARETKSLYLVNCDTTGAVILSSVDYDAKGNFLSEVDHKADDQPDYWPPDTLGYAVVKNICEPAFDTPS